MKRLINITLIGLTVALMAPSVFAQALPAKTCPAPWLGASDGSDDCVLKEFTLKTWSGWTGLNWDVTAQIRSGYLTENPNVPFRGNIIYYEGLGDSMLNHLPLFEKLTLAGYRVIAFDYMGQGGSTGDMNDTRIYQIGALGDKIWSLHARDLLNFPKKNIIGWSTGGLAAYAQAQMKIDVNTIVLIAPGIAPNKIVGEQDFLSFSFNKITLPTLTAQVYNSSIEDPHVDPIKPGSPLDVMDFSWDLTATARVTQSGAPLSLLVNGFVLLSGDNDTYVDARETREILTTFAPHFLVRQYQNALHEIDNEVEPIRSNAQGDILDFLNSHN